MPSSALLTNGQGNERGQNKATARILRTLTVFASDNDCYGVTELAQMLGMTKNMVYRALATLVEQGYVVRDPKGQRYQLGYRVLELQNRLAPEPDLRAMCGSFIRAVQQLTGETTTLIVRALDYGVIIDGIETRKPGTYRMVVGAVRPLHRIASGLVLLAFSSDDDIEDYIIRNRPLKMDEGQPDLAIAAFRNSLEKVRDAGHAEILRPGTLPMLSLAFPIWASGQSLHGTLSMGGPVARLSPQLPQLMPKIHEVLEALWHRTRLYPAEVQLP